MPARNPKPRALMTNGALLARAGFPLKPARKAPFSASLNDFRERCMASRNILSTSFSNVTVVLMPAS
jgi:hypothetical protein